MIQTVKDAYKEGRKAASLDPQAQQERRANVLERTEALANEMIEKLKIQGSMMFRRGSSLPEGFSACSWGGRLKRTSRTPSMGRVYLALFSSFWPQRSGCCLDVQRRSIWAVRVRHLARLMLAAP